MAGKGWQPVATQEADMAGNEQRDGDDDAALAERESAHSGSAEAG